jgi:hypothetical protein
VRYHANDLTPLSLRRAHPKKDLLPNGGLEGKGFGCENLIDDEQAAIGRVIGFGERAAGDQGGMHGFEIAGQHGLQVGGLELAWIRERFGGSPADGEKTSRQRHGASGGDGAHARYGGQAVREAGA